jgi:hypothetical protein
MLLDRRLRVMVGTLEVSEEVSEELSEEIARVHGTLSARSSPVRMTIVMPFWGQGRDLI